MTAISAIMRGRKAAEALMIDTCEIKRLTGEVTNLQTGIVTPTYTVLYSGIARFQRVRGQRLGSAHPVVVGEAQVYYQPLAVHVPTTVLGVHVNDIVTCLTCPLDDDLVNKHFFVQGLPPKTFITAHRFGLQEVTS